QVLPGFISCSVYCGLTYRIVKTHLESKELSTHKLTDLKWIGKLMRLLSVLLGLWLITIIVDFFPGKIPSYSWTRYLLGLPAIVFVYWLGVTTFLRQNKMQARDIEAYNKKVTKAYFQPWQADHFVQKLNQLMQDQKLYLDPLLKLDNVSTTSGISEKQISYLLNQHMGKNFNDFVNNYRIEEAKKKLSDPACNKFTISAIAFDCGFNSLATFQRAFKQSTGITPSQYQNASKSPYSAVNTTQIVI
ncbi:MAG: AraC family transcriptional regulator, partial [Sphingobacteriaceae bacterium]